MTAIASRRLAPAAKARLGSEIAWTALRARWLMGRCELSAALRKLRAPAGAARADRAPDLDEARRLAHAVQRTLAVVPGDSRCLVTSLVLVAVLARRGTSATLVIAVRAGAEFGAHAWVELDGVPLLPPAAGQFERFVEL